MDVAASNHDLRSENNSLPSASVAGVEISSQRPENPSFAISKLSPALAAAYIMRIANGCDTRFEKGYSKPENILHRPTLL